jgi:hypothetical protein
MRALNGAVVYLALSLAVLAAIGTTPGARTAVAGALSSHDVLEAAEDVGHMLEKGELFGKVP